MSTTLYLVEHARFGNGDVSGSLITVDGDVLHSHMSSGWDWLKNDLTRNFGRGRELTERFGNFRLVSVRLDEALPDEIRHHFNSPDDPDPTATSAASTAEEA